MTKTHTRGARTGVQVGFGSDGVAALVAIGCASIAPYIGQQQSQLGRPAGSDLIDLRGGVWIETGVAMANHWIVLRRQGVCNRN